MKFGAERFGGKRSVIVGAASGVGRATLLRLAEEGADVVGVDVDAEGLQKTIADAGTGKAITCDVRDTGAVAKLADVGPTDVLIYTAGVLDGFTPTGELTDEVWHRVLDVNVTGAMRVIRAMLPVMTEGGAITAVASVAAHEPGRAGTAYTVSKHALVGLVRSTAFFHDKVRANVVCPGAIATPMAAQPLDHTSWAVQRTLPALATATLAEPERIAAVIAWLSSDDAAIVNGAAVTADGGWTLS